jgi:hypothetical protein
VDDDVRLRVQEQASLFTNRFDDFGGSPVFVTQCTVKSSSFFPSLV